VCECAAVPRRARIQGAWTCVSLNSKLASNKEAEVIKKKEKKKKEGVGRGVPAKVEVQATIIMVARSSCTWVKFEGSGFRVEG